MTVDRERENWVELETEDGKEGAEKRLERVFTNLSIVVSFPFSFSFSFPFSFSCSLSFKSFSFSFDSLIVPPAPTFLFVSVENTASPMAFKRGLEVVDDNDDDKEEEVEHDDE